MSELVQVALIASIAPTLAALSGIVISWHNGRKITNVHDALNGKMQEVIDKSYAEGSSDERRGDADLKIKADKLKQYPPTPTEPKLKEE